VEWEIGKRWPGNEQLGRDLPDVGAILRCEGVRFVSGDRLNGEGEAEKFDVHHRAMRSQT